MKLIWLIHYWRAAEEIRLHFPLSWGNYVLSWSSGRPTSFPLSRLACSRPSIQDWKRCSDSSSCLFWAQKLHPHLNVPNSSRVAPSLSSFFLIFFGFGFPRKYISQHISLNIQFRTVVSTVRHVSDLNLEIETYS